MSFGIQDDGKYFVARDGTTYGPYRGDALPAMYAAKQVLSTDLISEVSGTEWITVAQAIATTQPSGSQVAPPPSSAERENSNGLGLASFVIGIVSFSLTFVGGGCVGIFFALLGLAFGVFGLFRSPRGFAIAGIILNGITVLLLALAALGFALCCIGAAAA